MQSQSNCRATTRNKSRARAIRGSHDLLAVADELASRREVRKRVQQQLRRTRERARFADQTQLVEDACSSIKTFKGRTAGQRIRSSSRAARAAHFCA
eukprot:556917-Pleurochrysis_carterae.AAC.1